MNTANTTIANGGDVEAMVMKVLQKLVFKERLGDVKVLTVGRKPFLSYQELAAYVDKVEVDGVVDEGAKRLFIVDFTDEEKSEVFVADEADALEAYADNFGFGSYEDFVAEYGETGLVPTEIDYDAILRAVSILAGEQVQPGEEGTGDVATVCGVSFETYSALAAYHGLQMRDYTI